MLPEAVAAFSPFAARKGVARQGLRGKAVERSPPRRETVDGECSLRRKGTGSCPKCIAGSLNVPTAARRLAIFWFFYKKDAADGSFACGVKCHNHLRICRLCIESIPVIVSLIPKGRSDAKSSEIFWKDENSCYFIFLCFLVSLCIISGHR